MRIAQTYNHLHAEEYLEYKQEELLLEIKKCIEEINANQYLKMSCAKQNICDLFYDQKALNEEIKERLKRAGWNKLIINYFVTCDQEIMKTVVKENAKERQKEIIENAGLEPMKSYNEVDFKKDVIAVEVQFGKYFSVAYDLHVKHTFFYLQDEIEVGIEIIPTHKMAKCMDSGVPWFENEVTNVIREGRNNPAVPIYIMGIESDDIISKTPIGYTDSELKEIIKHSNVAKLKSQMKLVKKEEEDKWNDRIRKKKDELDEICREIDQLDTIYIELDQQGKLDEKTKKKMIKQGKNLNKRREKAEDTYYKVKNSPSDKLSKIYRVEKVL